MKDAAMITEDDALARAQALCGPNAKVCTTRIRDGQEVTVYFEVIVPGDGCSLTVAGRGTSWQEALVSAEKHRRRPAYDKPTRGGLDI